MSRKRLLQVTLLTTIGVFVGFCQWRILDEDDKLARLSLLGCGVLGKLDLVIIDDRTPRDSIHDCFRILRELNGPKALRFQEFNLTHDIMNQIASLNNLRELSLTHSNVDDELMRSLSSLRNVNTLNLDDTKVTDQTLGYLATFPSLRRVTLTRSQVTDVGVSRLRALFPHIEIEF